LESEQFVEEQAKLKMGLKREGEKVAVVTDADQAEPIADQAEPVAQTGTPQTAGLKERWQRWFDYFLLEQ